MLVALKTLIFSIRYINSGSFKKTLYAILNVYDVKRL